MPAYAIAVKSTLSGSEGASLAGSSWAVPALTFQCAAAAGALVGDEPRLKHQARPFPRVEHAHPLTRSIAACKRSTATPRSQGLS